MFRLRRPVFNGVYHDISQVPGDVAWNKKGWLHYSRRKLDAITQNPPVLASNYISQLVLLLNLLLENKPLRILDYGGGTGYIFHAIKPYCPIDRLSWEVYDTSSELMELGKEYPGPTFTSSPSGRYDLLFLNVLIHYIHDYQATLEPFLHTEWIFMTRAYVGNIKPFYTQERIEGGTVPCIFHNLEEMHGWFGKNGYQLIFSADETTENLSNMYSRDIPADLRITYSKNILYRRIIRTFS